MNDTHAEMTAETANADTILEATDIVQSFGPVRVLEGLSIDFPAGTLTGIIGPNGSGKSTFIRILTGLLEQDSGTVTYHGESVPRPIGYLPQHPEFRPGFTTEETIEFYLDLVGQPDADPLAALDRVGLKAAADTRVEDLSGGMTRLLGVAQSMVGDPPVVIFDEPASGLDPGMCHTVFDIAEDLAAAGAAVIVTSHDLTEIERRCDKVAILDEGTFQAVGDPTRLLADQDLERLDDLYREMTTTEDHVVTVRKEQ